MLREYTCDSASDTHRRCGVGLLSQQVSQPPADGVSIHRRLCVSSAKSRCGSAEEEILQICIKQVFCNVGSCSLIQCILCK